MKSKVLIACEESQAVTIEMRRMGIEAYSCDIQDCSGGRPQWHIKSNVSDILNDPWDLVIAFPPCTDLASSGARWFEEKRRNGTQQASIDFFMQFTKLQCRWAIENPVGIMSKEFRKPDQIVNPWQFGQGETKATCLWLNNLPELKPTNIVRGRKEKSWRMPDSLNRQKQRSKTPSGMARAMALQWGYLVNRP